MRFTSLFVALLWIAQLYPGGKEPKVGNLAGKAGVVPVAEGCSDCFDNLLAGWKLDEVSGGTQAVSRADILGTYTLQDMGTTASAEGIQDLGANTVVSDGAYLVRYNLPIDASILALSGSGTRTISLWFKPDALGLNQIPFELSINYAGGFRVWLNTNGTVSVAFNYAPALNRSALTTDVATAGEWNYLAAWYDDNDTKIHAYLNNGTEATSVTFSLPASGQVASINLTIGTRADYYNFGLTGVIDEVYVFTDVKDAAWVATMYNSGAGQPYPN